jgi:K(+)-stimulated pyrophosphate-energized sodium pump
VIADNVGDNAGDMAGMGADSYQSYVDTTLAALLSGRRGYSSRSGFFWPAYSALTGIAAVNTLARASKAGPEMVLGLGMAISSVVTLLGIWLLSHFYARDVRAFYAGSSGLIAGVAIGLTDYSTSGRPVDTIAASGEWGAATAVITGLSVGMQSATLPMVVLGLSMIAAFRAWGIYGVSLSGVGLLSILGITLSMDAYGPIADNAAAIAEMTCQHPRIRRVTDRLDAAGNTAAAVAKALAVSATAAAAL